MKLILCPDCGKLISPHVVALSDLYRMAALWHGGKEAQAKRAARRNGVSWRVARKQFIKENSI